MTALIKRARSGLRRRFDRFIRKLGRRQRLLLRLVSDHVEFEGAREICALSGRQTDFSSPLLYDEGLKIIRQPPINAPVSDVHFLELTNVGVIGSTMAVTRDGKVLHPELLHTESIHDYKVPDVYQFADAGRRSLNLNVFTRFGGQKRVKVGLHLLKEHSYNYYHWLAECLPRLIFFLENKGKIAGDARITVLIDGNILEQAVESLRRLIPFPCAIEMIGRGELVRCDRLFYVSPFWHALDNTKHKVNPQKDLPVDKYAVGLVRNAFCKSAGKAPPSRKIYLPRKADQIRKIINARQVEDLMIENGFEVVHPHELSFRQQLELFASAQIVVGASGAAFSNIVFMQPKTKAVIFSPKDLDVFNYYIFQQQADVAQVELMHLLGVPARKENFYIHDDFSVNCDDLHNLIHRIT